MAKDYAKNRSGRTRAKANSSSRWLWLFLGLIVGFLITNFHAVREQATKLLVQSSEKNAVKVTKSETHHPAAVKEQQQARTDEKVRFDFYTILPKMQVRTPGGQGGDKLIISKPEVEKPLGDVEQKMLSPHAVSQNSVQAKFKMSQGQEPEKLPTPTLGDTDVNPPVLKHIQAKAALQKYIIQVASFKRYEDADELKARLVMMGFEATIKDAPSGGITWKRVWLGPFNSLQEAAQVQQRLAQNHIQGVVGRLRVEK